MSVAQTIREQIGHKAFCMLGAYNLTTNDGNNLAFRVKGSKKVNYVNVEYNESLDLYNMSFKKIWGTKVKDVKNYEGVYADMMHDLIETETGLYTKLF